MSNTKLFVSKSLQLLLVATATIGSFSFFPSPNVSAQNNSPEEYFAVTATKGLNVRDQNCKIIDTLTYQTIISKITRENSPSTIKCTLNGLTVNMIQAGGIQAPMWDRPAYVAEMYTSPVIQNSKFSFGLTVNATAGLNLRDSKCKKIKTVPNNTIFSKAQEPAPSFFMTCKRDGKYYRMAQVNYQGKDYVVAEAYLK